MLTRRRWQQIQSGFKADSKRIQSGLEPIPILFAHFHDGTLIQVEKSKWPRRSNRHRNNTLRHHCGLKDGYLFDESGFKADSRRIGPHQAALFDGAPPLAVVAGALDDVQVGVDPVDVLVGQIERQADRVDDLVADDDAPAGAVQRGALDARRVVAEHGEEDRPASPPRKKNTTFIIIG